LTTATLGDHLAAQGLEKDELYSRGARVRKRDLPVVESDAVQATEFLAVKILTPSESAPKPAVVRCRLTHRSGHVLEFNEWPEAAWLAAVLGGAPGTIP
jgi:hypothetical protein